MLELQETAVRRYLIVRTGRYETLLRAAPATAGSSKGYLLAFADELVFHRRRQALNRQSAPSPGSSFLQHGGLGPLRLGYKDIAEAVADGSRLNIHLNPGVQDVVPVDFNTHSGVSTLPAPLPMVGRGQRKNLAHSLLRKVMGLFLPRSQSSPSRPAPLPGTMGRRLSRMGADVLFDVARTGSEATEPLVVALELESTNVCSQMQVIRAEGSK